LHPAAKSCWNPASVVVLQQRLTLEGVMQVSNRRFGRNTLLGSAVVGILAAAAASAQQAPAEQEQQATEK
jgi:uncharacterized protein YfaQ (DUF2300 family)